MSKNIRGVSGHSRADPSHPKTARDPEMSGPIVLELFFAPAAELDADDHEKPLFLPVFGPFLEIGRSAGAEPL